MKRFMMAVAMLFSQTTLAQPDGADAFIASNAKDRHFNGATLIEKQGRTSYAGSFGLANIPFKDPNTQQPKFKFACITKPFTSVLIIQL